MTTLGVAVVGGGFMARVHSTAARAAGARLVSVASSSPERGEQAARELGFERSAASVAELLEDADVDVVHVCTPNALHAEQAAAVLASGRHVVCEKPLATDVDDARRLVEQAEGSGLVATVPFVYRFYPLVREARARFRAGDMGAVTTITGSYLQDWLLGAEDQNWRVDAAAGGASRAFADIGSHLVDLLEFITGDRITALAASTSTLHRNRGSEPVRTEDAAALTLRTEGGAVGSLLVSQVAPGRKNRLALEVAGTEATLGLDTEQPETVWLGRRAGSQLLPRDADQLSPDAARLCTVPAGHAMGYQDAFNAFVADTYAATTGADPEGLPRFADGLRAGVVTRAVLDSAATGAWTTL
ncbi:Gfo/Idh/MocA family protein [Auraticoccus monumenti]|uniref:Predicted dehydrogenase n=1 Tax=Auraticoccus monumenti TaxID=675864 RepID=A0A1G6ZV45_9ACTN|nr:Gfo/Idh/MocA family oxidoreductase [Auraticoccus monumenti]SDE06411.1 Predicted dehydrogenase [Auraticoccus monumenti]